MEHEQTPFLEPPFHEKTVSFHVVHGKVVLRNHTRFLSKICRVLCCPRGATLLCVKVWPLMHPVALWPSVGCCMRHKARL